MATQIDNGARAQLAIEATRDLLWVVENHGGQAGQDLSRYMIAGADSSMGELEVRLALGALATAQRQIIERLDELEERLGASESREDGG